MRQPVSFESDVISTRGVFADNIPDLHRSRLPRRLKGAMNLLLICNGFLDSAAKTFTPKPRRMFFFRSRSFAYLHLVLRDLMRAWALQELAWATLWRKSVPLSPFVDSMLNPEVETSGR